MSSSGEDDLYGPPLPPSLKLKPNQKKEDPATSSEDEDEHGPSLPPHLSQSSRQRRNTGSDDDSESDAYVPSLPPNLLKSKMRENSDSDSYGPTLPLSKHESTKNKREESSDSEEDAYVPSLPPSMQQHGLKRKEESEANSNKLIKKDSEEDSEDSEDMYGAALPPHLMKNKNNDASLPSTKRIKGPTLPPGFVPPEMPSSFTKSEEETDSESDDDQRLIIGPTPSAVPLNAEEYRIQQLELRAKRMKDKLEGKFDESKAVKRETWMLELPEDKPNFCGLEARQFRRKAPQEKGDRSIWTDTPADKERKAKQENEDHQEEVDPEVTTTQKRDEDLTARVDTYNKEKRAKPLIELHKKKLKEKSQKSGPKERKPFSREEDMNVNKFDEAQKSTILKKARQLNDRFSAGGKKFL